MTDYTISEKLVAAAIADRGKAHPWDRFPIAKTALVVVDMQNYFVAPDSQGQPNPAQGIVPSINRLAAAMRALGKRHMDSKHHDQHPPSLVGAARTAFSCKGRISPRGHGNRG